MFNLFVNKGHLNSFESLLLVVFSVSCEVFIKFKTTVLQDILLDKFV